MNRTVPKIIVISVHTVNRFPLNIGRLGERRLGAGERRRGGRKKREGRKVKRGGRNEKRGGRKEKRGRRMDKRTPCPPPLLWYSVFAVTPSFQHRWNITCRYMILHTFFLNLGCSSLWEPCNNQRPRCDVVWPKLHLHFFQSSGNAF